MGQIFQQQQRVHKNIAFGMKLRRLLHALHRGNLGQDFCEQARLVEQEKGLAGVTFGEHLGQFVAHSLAGDLIDLCRQLSGSRQMFRARCVYPKRAAKRTARSIRSLSSAKRSSGWSDRRG